MTGRCLAIPLGFAALVALTTASSGPYGSYEERCEAELKVIRKNIIILKSTIIHLKAKIAKLPYGPIPGEETCSQPTILYLYILLRCSFMNVYMLAYDLHYLLIIFCCVLYRT